MDPFAPYTNPNAKAWRKKTDQLAQRAYTLRTKLGQIVTEVAEGTCTLTVDQRLQMRRSLKETEAELGRQYK